MHENIFYAAIEGGSRGEGLTLTVIDGERLSVAIELEHRRRVVTLEREGALRMAEAIRGALGERLAA